MADKTLKEMILDLNDGLGISQREIGEAIGVKQSTVSDFITERTKGKRIHYKTYEALKKFHALKMRAAQRAA